MEKLNLTCISNLGEDPLQCGKDRMFTIISKNKTFYSSVKEQASFKEVKNVFELNIKKDLLTVLKDSKNWMFSVQLMKYAKTTEININDSRFELLSITTPSHNDLEEDNRTIEVMVQVTKSGHVHIHKAILNISVLNVEKVSGSKDGLKFEAKIKINNVEYQAGISIYFVLQALSLICGNYSLFSCYLITGKSECKYKILLSDNYNMDEKKRKYTLNYIKKSINHLIQQKEISIKSDDEKKLEEQNLNDQTNQLLMLGMAPSSIHLLHTLLNSQNKDAISEANIEIIADVNKEENVFQSKGKSMNTNIFEY